MATDRRALLQGALAALACPLVAGRSAASAGELFAAGRRGASGAYEAAIFSPAGGDVTSIRLPARGHDVAIRPGSRECVLFARRPGTFAVAFGPSSPTAARWIEARPGRHFYGHGAFSTDGRLLYATENDYEAGDGVIGIRDATDRYRQIAEFASGGIGPHDIALLPDGHTLVIANGGIETHPSYGREPLNLHSMQPSLVYLDLRTGDPLETHRLPADLHQLSIRHLAVAGDGDGTVIFGCQQMGAKTGHPSLLGFHRRGSPLRLADIPADATRSLNGYVGSLSVDRSGTIVAATSPRGGVALYLDIPGRRFIGSSRLDDNCGVAARTAPRSFLLTSGKGRLATVDARGGEPATTARTSVRAVQWDNHLARL